MGVKQFEVPTSKLNNRFDPDEFGFEASDEIESLDGTIGQERAVSALELALNIDAAGLNLFISGLPGTGRNTALRSHLERIASGKPIPPDWGYVHNFQDPSQPVALSLPCGMMRELVRDMEELVQTCQRDIPRAYEADDYVHRVEEVMNEVQSRRQAVTNDLEKDALKQGFALTSTPGGVRPVPVQEDGTAMSPEQFNALPEEVREVLRKKADEVQHSVNHAMSELRRLSKEATQLAEDVDRELIRFTLGPVIDELIERYGEYPAIIDYLDQVAADMVEHVEIFKPKEDEAQPPAPFGGPSSDEDIFARYRINDLVDNTSCDGAPVIIEYSPTYYNLFGRIDYKAGIGTFTTDLTMIKAGAIHRANGGYLVL